MTVAELAAELAKLPQDAPVTDGQDAMAAATYVESHKIVVLWFGIHDGPEIEGPW